MTESTSFQSNAISRARTRHETRASTTRAELTTSSIDLTNAASPAETFSPTARKGVKRKQQDFDLETREEGNINIVVRCRGRKELEMRDTSAVVVVPDGVNGTSIKLIVGSNSLSNKTYSFDRVFSSVADQSMLFDEVVKPILDEVRSTPSTTFSDPTDVTKL